MRRIIKQDEFFDKQPELLFLNDLKAPLHKEKKKTFGKRLPEVGEVLADGMYLVREFPDGGGLLETAYEDFEAFLHTYDLQGERFPIVTRLEKTDTFEEYFIEIDEMGVSITAGDTEGIRRGIFYLEDELVAREGACLPAGRIKRTPHIRKRITRGYFSPTNRPPKFGDELSDDIDYYPENYLNRLAHDGSNGLWIYTRLSDLIPSAIIPEYGDGYERRIEKLNQVCEKCARYGIGVYVLAIEPYAPEDEEVIKNHRDLLGGSISYDEPGRKERRRTFCTHTKKGRAYCIEAMRKLCLMVPRLIGFISITAGERPTSCASEGAKNCPHCGHIDRGESLAQTIDCLKEGIRQSGRDMEFISWTYGHRMWEEKDIADYVKHAPQDVMLMQNFDDMGYEPQLGRMRQGVDYWLSYPGPSPLFEKTGVVAKEYGKHMYAKMQVCCSHEIASVPYIPVPGIIFDKFKGAHELGVEGVMECWYFGNYPSIMSKAAGELSFWEDFSNKEGFLKRLASIFSGRSAAKTLCSAWNSFEEGYRKYPLNVMFSYYGPMHDGVCWQLYLKPRNFSLPRTWLLLDRPDGDRIYESLLCGHTLEEAILLTGEMSKKFTEGLQMLEGVNIPEEHRSLIEAVDTLFCSGNTILKFYRKREQLGLGQEDAKNLLSEMRALVLEEMDNSRRMIDLCRRDNRLGYHSEAEGYKFFPAKLEDRIKKLQMLLDTEFPEVEERVEKGLLPLEYYAGVEEEAVQCALYFGDIFDAEVHTLRDGKSKFAVSYDDANLYIKVCSDEEVTISAEFQLMHPYPPVAITPDGQAKIHWKEAELYYSLFGEFYDKEMEKWKSMKTKDGTLVTLDRRDIGWMKNTPIKLSVMTNSTTWIEEEKPVYSLGKVTVSPGEFGWFLP